MSIFAADKNYNKVNNKTIIHNNEANNEICPSGYAVRKHGHRH